MDWNFVEQARFLAVFNFENLGFKTLKVRKIGILVEKELEWGVRNRIGMRKGSEWSKTSITNLTLVSSKDIYEVIGRLEHLKNSNLEYTSTKSKN